jgi:LacI family transcriptional regulator
MPKRRRVALLVAAWNHYGRGIIEGAWNYAQAHGWNLDMRPSGPDGAMQMPEGWQGDGIIATVHSPKLGADLRAYGVPVVNVSGARFGSVRFPRVASDADAVVTLAVEHLRSKGCVSVRIAASPTASFSTFGPGRTNARPARGDFRRSSTHRAPESGPTPGSWPGGPIGCAG